MIERLQAHMDRSQEIAREVQAILAFERMPLSELAVAKPDMIAELVAIYDNQLAEDEFFGAPG